LESKKSPKKGPVFQNLLEDRMKRLELILASFQRQEIQSREESRKREILLFGMTTEFLERIYIHDAKLTFTAAISSTLHDSVPSLCYVRSRTAPQADLSIATSDSDKRRREVPQVYKYLTVG